MGQLLSREDDDQCQDQNEQQEQQEQQEHPEQLHVPKRRQRNAAAAIRSRKTKTYAQGRTRRKTVAFE
jgi:hypothetical protein